MGNFKIDLTGIFFAQSMDRFYWAPGGSQKDPRI